MSGCIITPKGNDMKARLIGQTDYDSFLLEVSGCKMLVKPFTETDEDLHADEDDMDTPAVVEVRTRLLEMVSHVSALPAPPPFEVTAESDGTIWIHVTDHKGRRASISLAYIARTGIVYDILASIAKPHTPACATHVQPELPRMSSPSGVPPRNATPACHQCGKDDNDCVCPECPVCGSIGDPKCESEHGMRADKPHPRA